MLCNRAKKMRNGPKSTMSIVYPKMIVILTFVLSDSFRPCFKYIIKVLKLWILLDEQYVNI